MRPAAPRDWAWDADELTREIVARLRGGERLETRQFLKPVFRWMKIGVHKDGKRDNDAVDKAFAYVDWLVQLSTGGDEALGIPPLPELQPSYALNTIVTASQRAGSLEEAVRAFDLLEKYGYEPDVFTYTALIDVTARSGDVQAAIARYEAMRKSSSKPNIVTYTTLIRSVGFNDSVDTDQCLTFLTHAREDNTFDDALFLEAITVCAHRKNLEVAEVILREISLLSPKLRSDGRFFHVVAELVMQFDDGEENPILDKWLQQQVISTDEHSRILANANDLRAAAAASKAAAGTKAVGCLGYQTSESVRKAVVHHDIARLMERIRAGMLVTVNDFETLIHQCRKRKWKEDVEEILDAMRRVANHGWTSSDDNADEDNSISNVDGSSLDATSSFTVPNEEQELQDAIPPQPQLLPTSKTFVAVVDAYLTCGDEPKAWEIVEYVGQQPGLSREFGLYRKFIRGAYLLTNCDHILPLVRLARQDGVTFTARMCVEIARMFGYRHQEGLSLIVDDLGYLVEPSQKTARQQGALEELVKSCAYKGNEQGVEDTLKSMSVRGFRRSANTETAVFIACIQHTSLDDAKRSLQHLQKEKLVMRIPVYDSLLREMYFKYTRRGAVFDEASRKVAMKTLYVRRALFEQAFQDWEVLEAAAYNRTGDGEEIQASSGDNESALYFWCSHSELNCSPLMFAQHAVEVLTTIRDKAAKIAAESTIRAALITADDPVMFLLRAVMSLRFLDLTYRSLGKLAKQLLALMSSQLTFEDRHAEYCVSQLPLLTVHIVKELDDVVRLHHSYSSDLLAFALEALDRDNVDKVIGFVTNRQELFTLETARVLTPKLAEMFVYGGVSSVVQFYKPDGPDSLEMRRLFIREVIEMESLDQPDDEEEGEEDEGVAASTFPCTSRAIRELRLQHEPEFMPFVMHSLRERQLRYFAKAERDEDDGCPYLKLPLANDQVVFVDNDEDVARAYSVLKSESVDALGLDAEWRPDGYAGMQSRVAVLQVACSTHVFLFDFISVSIGDLEDLFSFLFSSERIVKLGFALDGDIKRLRWSFPDSDCFDVFKNVLDLSFETLAPVSCLEGLYSFENAASSTPLVGSRHHRRRTKGLSALVKDVLGLPLRKTQQRSDWEQRPLTPAQIAYASLDAFCLLMVLDKLRANS